MLIGVLRLSSLGDIVLTGPAVRGIRKAFPDAEIVYLTTTPYQNLAAALPGVDRVEAIERRGKEFHLALDRLSGATWNCIADLQGSPRSREMLGKLKPQKHIIYTPPRFRRSLLIYSRLRVGRFDPVPVRQLAALSRWGVMDDGLGLSLKLDDRSRETVLERFPVLGDRPFVLVPGARHGTKRWPGSYWNRLLGKLIQFAPVVLLGAKGETPPEIRETFEIAGRGDSRLLDLTGQTDILESAHVLSQARVVISGDTGPMHLAVAVGAKVVAIFGPTVEEFGFFPFRVASARIHQQDLWCRPCSAHGPETCPLGHHKCMKLTSVEEVYDSVVNVSGT